MNEQAINDLYNLAKQNGYTKSLDEFVNLMYTNDNAFNDMYSLAKNNGYQKSQDDFSVLIGKKKSEAQPQPTAQAQPMAQKPQAPAAMASSSGASSLASPSAEERGLTLLTPEKSKQMAQEAVTGVAPTKLPDYGKILEGVPVEPVKEEKPKIKDETPKEEPYFKGSFGELLQTMDSPLSVTGFLGIGDFIDDMGRALDAGSKQGATATPSNQLMVLGPNASPEKIRKFVQAAKQLENVPPSDEMINFSKIYEEEGKGVYGLIKGLALNPSILPEVMVSSIRGMVNASSAAAAGTVIGGAAAGGAAFGGVGAGATALASIPYAMAAAGTTLETGMSFAEFMKEKLDQRGLEFNEENVKKILEDKDALSDIRTRAVARGATIGAIDALTGRVAGKVGAKLAEGTGAAAVRAGLASSTIEAVGGATGEAAGRAVAGQEMDVAEIALEGLGEVPMAAIDVTAEVLRKPLYKINGEVRTAADVEDMINNASAEDLQNINFDIRNDRNGFNQQIQDKIVTNQVRNEIKDASPDIDDESLNQLTTLEMELRKVEGNKTQTGRDKANQIRSQIREVQQAAAEKKAAPAEAPSVAPSEAKPITYDQLSDEAKTMVEREVDLYQSNIDAAKENNREPDEWDVSQLELLKSDPVAFLEEVVSTTTNEERKTLAEQALTKIKEEQNAIQVETAGQVPVQPTARPSEEVAQGEPQAEPQVTAQAGVEEEVSRLEQAFGGAFAETEQMLPASVDATVLEAVPMERKMELTFTQEDGTVSPLNGNEQMASDLYQEAVAIPKAQRTPAQQSVVDMVVSAQTQKPSGVSVSNKAQVAELETKTTDADKKKIIKAATTAINTLKSIFPDMDIVIHESNDSYTKQVGQSTRGNFEVTRTADGKIVGGRIDINLSKANMRTVAHEVAHAVMLKAFGDNPALFKVFRDRITKILSDTNVKKLNDFASQYEENNSHEEFLVELSAALTEAQKQLKPITVNKIAQLINKVVSKITGGRLQPFGEKIQTNELIDFMNTMSSAIGRGEAIQVKEGATKGAAGVVSKAQVEGIVPKTRAEVEAALSRGDRVIGSLEMDDEPMDINSMEMVDRVDLNTMLIIPATTISKAQKKEITKFAEDEKGKIRPEQGGDRRGRYSSGSLAPLAGAPNFQGARGPDPELVAVAEKYAQENGIDLKRQAEYVSVDEDRAKRIADAYEDMAHNPNDPKVKEAYADLIAQTKKQYQALADAGYVFSFFDSKTDPYNGNPVDAMRDLRNNKRMAVYGTYDGYGTEGITKQERESNPMLEDTGLRWKDQNGVEHPVTANDLFRAVHDAFGHGLEGAGFRARGEENAWQAHVRLFTGPAVAAITTETRGQNSWLNYGPFGEKNRNAKLEDTVFADNKIGLMPEWTWTEGRAADMPTTTVSKAQKAAPREGGDIIKDTKNYGKTKEGLTITQTSEGPFLSDSGNSNYGEMDDIRGKEVQGGISNFAIRNVWNTYKNIKFNGSVKVQNASDVAHIMRQLENKSVEHGFAVHVDEKGKAHIQFLGMGGVAGTVMDPMLILAGVKRYGSKQVYMVHNHPSGAMKPSDADIKITQQVRNLLSDIDVGVEHVILDTYRREYVHIDIYNYPSVFSRDVNKENNEKYLKSLKTEMLDEFDVLTKPFGNIKSSNDAAQFFTQMRFTALPKNGMLVLNRANDVIGNYILPNDFNYKDVTDNLVKGGIGQAVIFYSNQDNYEQIKNIKSKIENANIAVLDYIRVDSNSTSVNDFYKSYADKGLLRESQEKYGTNSVEDAIGEPTVATEVKEMGETFTVSKAQKADEEVRKVVKDARAQGYSEAAIKAFLVKKGFTEQEADALMSKPEAGKKIELGEELMEGYDRMMDEVDGIIEKGLNRGSSQNKIMENVLAYVQGSKAYENATDQQREQIVREVKQAFGEKMKSAPSVGKILGKDVKKVTMTEMSLLKKQLKDLARGARDAKTAISNGTKSVTEMLNKMVKSGSISSAQLKTIINKFGSLNVLNEKSLNRFIDYMTKVIADADYSSKLENAQSLRKAIKKLSRNKEKNASMRELAKRFVDIDPSLVDDIDAYNDIAQKIKESVKGSTIREGKITQAEMVNIEDSNEYISETMDAQRQKLFDEKAAEIQELLGVDVSDLSYEQLLEMVDKKEKITKYNEGLVRSAIIRMFGTYSSIIEQMFSTSKDPFTGEDIDIDPKKKELVQRFMDMDLNQFTAKQGLEAVDALTNFIQNGSTAKMEAVVSEYTGEKNAMELEEKGVKSEPLKAYKIGAVGRLFAEQFMSLPVMLERMFKGVKRASLFEKMSGLIDLRNKKSAADRKVTDIINDYVDKFYKEKANGEDFNTSYNATERGLVAFMTRNVVGTAKQMAEEFARRKALIEESIEVLSKGNDAEKAKAELYQKAYDKLLKDSKDGDEVRSKADKKNLEAIDYWKNKWAEIYDDLSDVSENVYNTLLDKDLNYTPDRYTRLDSAGERTPLENDQSMFHGNTNTIYKKKTGVLMEAERPKQLPRFEGKKKAGMYVDLSFDRNNANSMYDALVDINTAATIRQVEAFINSESFDSIIDNPKDAKVLKGRIQQFVRNMRDKNIVESDELSKAARSLNVMATIGVGQALGGVFQPFKQTIPVIVNTMINAGKINMSIPFNTAVNDFLNNSGYAIANRGLASSAELSSIEKLAELAESSTGEKIVKALEAANKKMLEILLVKADVAVARASWIAYYEKSLQEQGIDTKGIDYSKHELNNEAADYAQRMVDRQQNISDHDLAGKFFTSKDAVKQVFVKAVMPFASFRINQWMRMTTDLSILKSKTASKEDKRIAARSLAGFTAEMFTFKLVSLGIIMLMGTLTKALMGHDEDDEEEKKRFENAKKGQLTGTITDVFSPLPFADKPIQAGAGWLINKVQDIMGIAEEEKTTIFPPQKSDTIASLGAFGIAAERVMQLIELAGLATNGKFKDDYGNEKQISEQDMEVLKYMFGLAVLSNIGLAPTEANTIVRNSIKFAKKGGKTEKSIKAEQFSPPNGLTKEQFKRYFPEEYEEKYGEGSMYYKMTQPEREQKKKAEDEKQKLMDEYYDYEEKSKKGFGSKGFGEEKKKKEGFGSKSFGSKGFGE